MDILLLKVILLLLMLSVTFAFAMMPVIFIRYIQKIHDSTQRFKYHLRLSFMSCAAGGVFMGSCIMNLLPDVQSQMNILMKDYNIQNHYPVAEFIVMFGMLLVLTVEQITLDYKETSIVTQNSDTEVLFHDMEQRTNLQINHSMDGISTEVDISSSMNERRSLMRSKDNNSTTSALSCDQTDGHRHDDLFEHSVHVDISSHSAMRSCLLLVALSLHSMFEGLAVGLQPTIDNALQLCTVVIFHKAIIALSLSINMVQSRLSLKQIIFGNILFSITAPIGVALGIGIMEMPQSPTTSLISGILQGMACGTFLFVTFFEVLPHEFNRGGGRVMKLLFTILGFSAVCVVLYFDSRSSRYVCHKEG